MPQKDKFGRHEVLDRTHIILSMIDDHILDHGGLRRDEKILAKAAADILGDLYQLVGSRCDLDGKKNKAKKK